MQEANPHFMEQNILEWINSHPQLTLNDLKIMYALLEQDQLRSGIVSGVSQYRLAELCQVTQANVSVALRRLAAAGAITMGHGHPRSYYLNIRLATAVTQVQTAEGLAAEAGAA